MFSGTRFWISQKVPQRSRFVEGVRSNGGEVTQIEKHADVMIVDHMRKEQPPGSYSYTFIDDSLRHGTLEDLADHSVGPNKGTVRTVGSIAQPTKNTRKKFTAADDRMLWDWVMTNPQKGGGTDGNEIYKQLEVKHPHHPWQSWRDRYIKKLKDRPQPYAAPVNGPPTPPADLQTLDMHQLEQSGAPDIRKIRSLFNEKDAKALLDVAGQIMDIRPESVTEAWKAWSESIDGSDHTPKQWQIYWEEIVQPRYLREQAAAERESNHGSSSGVQREDSRKQSTSSESSHHAQHHNSLAHRPDTGVQYLPMDGQKQQYVRMPEQPGSQPRSAQQRSSTKLSRSVENTPKDVPAETLKRKRVDMAQASSILRLPLGITQQHDDRSPPHMREVPSTPDRSPPKQNLQASSPLFVEDAEEVEVKIEMENDEARILPGVDTPYEDTNLLPSDFVQAARQIQKRREGTEAILAEEIPDLGFEVAPPYESGSEEKPPRSRSPTMDFQVAPLYIESGDRAQRDSSPELKQDDESDADLLDALPSTIPETQNFFTEPTPIPDLDIAMPDGGFDSPPSSSPPAIPHVDQNAESESSNTTDQLAVFVENAEARGLPREAASRAITSTSLDSELAKKVLEYMRKGKPKSTGKGMYELPNDWRGVWTQADDDGLRATDGREIDRLHNKHGAKSFRSRWEFLNAYDQAA